MNFEKSLVPDLRKSNRASESGWLRILGQFCC